jgi:hypothetical protein
MKKFECHITIVDSLRLGDDHPSSVKRIVEKRGWKFSCIQGDPDFGTGSFCYATRWFDEEEQPVTMVHIFKDQFIKEGLSVIRVKVERVVHDARLVNGEWKEMR